MREGLRMADEARLPEMIKAFIREHHGTQTIRYFLEKARAQEGVTELDPNDFAYSGPKPQSKETAIAMLGDAVESASRTLAEPSPERIRALIERLVQDRIDEGELDECSLTFRELGIVKREFAHVLTGLYHHRIDYPKPGARADASGDMASRAPVGTSAPRIAESLPERRLGGQLTIELEQAAQGDTGPVPRLDPAGSASPPETRSSPTGMPEGSGAGRSD